MRAEKSTVRNDPYQRADTPVVILDRQIQNITDYLFLPKNDNMHQTANEISEIQKYPQSHEANL